MPLTVTATDARAWSSWLRLARLQVGFATAQGRLSAAMREPETVTRVGLLILQEVADLPRHGDVALAAPDDPDFLVFAHYQRAATVWLDELADRGLISAVRDERVRRFERALLRYAGLGGAEPEPPGPRIVVNLTRPSYAANEVNC